MKNVLCKLDELWLSISPDGEKVLYYRDGDLRVYPMSEFITRQSDEDYEPQDEYSVETSIHERHRAVWSADSSKIAFMTKRNLRIWDLASGNLSVIAVGDSRPMSIAWCEDGLVAICENCDVIKYEPGKAPRNVDCVHVDHPELNLRGIYAFPEHGVITIPTNHAVYISLDHDAESIQWDQEVSVWCPVVHCPNDKAIAMLAGVQYSVLIYRYSEPRHTIRVPGVSCQLGGWHPVHGLVIAQSATEGDGYDLTLVNCQADSPDITSRTVCKMRAFIKHIQWVGDELLIVDQHEAVYKISVV